ncbi:N-acetyl-D-Glu racemase DgcA [Phenylobacterium sp.]|uniref:N-acetyl-D-Glu racemase DgcA n=1 Tax=Phenylobacterium sp. TaxID=1871053 RepID=UPI0035B4B731
MRVEVREERWPIDPPLRISRGVMDSLPMIVVEVEDDEGRRGRGEAAGVPYDGETPKTMTAQIEAISGAFATLDRAGLQRLLGPGGARNALDCALWDLEAKAAGVRAWRLAGLAPPGPLVTAFTIGLGDAEEVRGKARAAADLPLLKIKLDAERAADVVAMVRAEAPRAEIIVDANQAWDLDQLNAAARAMEAHGVSLIEQPLPRGQDPLLAGYTGSIRLAADESCVDRASLDALEGLYQLVNIKLDKTGGLTEALALAAAAKARGFQVMVGCMAGTSLAMAPASLVGQGAAVVDLDGPLMHGCDRPHGLVYERGIVSPPTPELWG